MSVSVVQTQNTDVNGHVSKWQAVHEPIEFLLERQDQQVSLRYTPTGFTVRINVIGAIPSEVAVGQQILWKSGVDYKTYTITQIYGTTIVTDGLDAGSVVGGHVVYLDAYNNYFIESFIYYVGSGGYEIIGAGLKNKTNLQGNVTLSLASMLKTKAGYDNNFDYDVLNKAVIGEGGKYNLRFREVYNSIEQPLSSYFSALQYFTNSAKQISEIYGSNMGEYVPTLDDTRPDKAKFLTVFNKPTAFKNMPFSLSFIYSDNLLNEQIETEQIGRDINSDVVFNDTGVLNIGERAKVNRLMLLDGVADDIKTIELWLQTTGTTVISSPFDNGNIFVVGVFEPLAPVGDLPPQLEN